MQRTVSQIIRCHWLLPAAVLLIAASIASGQPFPAASKLPSVKGLPDPLVMFDGTRVTTKQQWTDHRRGELKALFRHYMYGYPPPAPKEIKATVAAVDKKFFSGKATKKEIRIKFGPAGTPPINLLLVVPNKRKGPAPVFLAVNFRGNDQVLGERADRWAVENTIDRGYALATFHTSDVDPDKPDFTDGIHPHYLKPGQKKPGLHDWGTIAAWAWGVHRAVDYLYKDEDIDNDRIAVTGHSRLGKTALLAGALDERIDLIIPHQSGCGGAAPSRSKMGESVTQINDRFPHWFNDTFPKFNGREDRLPFDQHCLMALCAPRPLLITNGVKDTWANPPGTFEMVKAADGVYRLLGVSGLQLNKMPKLGQQDFGRLSYYIRDGGHTLDKGYWNVFLDFADNRFAKATR